MAEDLRDKCQRRLDGMKRVRKDYEPEAWDIARFAQPARSRFLTNEKDRGERRRQRNARLLDPHGIEAFRTLTNGMTSGLSSASRPWFTLTIKDEDTLEEDGVREWLSDVEARIYALLAQTNFYGAAKSGYSENGLFGTEACVMMEHPKLGMVCHPLTFGEYWIAVSDAMVPDTLYRLCPMTVRQAIMSFGNSVSQTIRTQYDSGDYLAECEIYQAIEPDDGHDPERFGSKPIRSIYWDAKDEKSLLRTSGFLSQPFWAARWDVVGGDTYGVSPGMEALPALRELQMQAKRRNEAIDHLAKPEKVVPANLRLTGQPGNTVSANGITRDQVIVPYQMPYQAVEAIGQEIDKCRMQIDGLSFADLFNAITNMRGVQPRNVEEIASRNEEKLTQLGPVIERVSTEKLQPAISRVYDIMDRGGMIPPVPEAMSGRKIEVEFVSILQQMQRMVGLGQIERMFGFVGNVTAAVPEALDNIDTDEAIHEYSRRSGSPPKILRSAKKRDEMRQARAAQEQAMQAAHTLAPVKDGAQAAQLLSETDTGNGQSLLSRLLPA